MKVTTLLLFTFAALSAAKIAADDKNFCHAHQTEKTCDEWRISKYPVDDGPEYSIAQNYSYTTEKNRDSCNQKSLQTSRCKTIKPDQKYKSFAMDTMHCTKDDVSYGDDGGFGKFNAIAFYRQKSCGTEGECDVKCLHQYNGAKQWTYNCWPLDYTFKSYAYLKMEDNWIYEHCPQGQAVNAVDG